MGRPICERMREARAKMVEQRRRVPRVFYLSRPDYAEFSATEPPSVEAMFALPLGHKPQPMTCLALDGLPVRESTRKPDRRGRQSSNLISCCGVTVTVPA